MRINDYDKALADYAEAIKTDPGEIRYTSIRGYIYECAATYKTHGRNRRCLEDQFEEQEAVERKSACKSPIANRSASGKCDSGNRRRRRKSVSRLALNLVQDLLRSVNRRLFPPSAGGQENVASVGSPAGASKSW